MTIRVGRPAALLATSLACFLIAARPVFALPSGWLNADGNERYSGPPGSYDWANSGAASFPQACPAGAVDVTGGGGLFNCGSPGAAGAPPNPPVLTPAAASDASIISAPFVVDPISTDTTACGAGDSSTIGGKNGDPISSYAVATGPVPAKDDLSNVFAVSHTRADTGRPELYFGAERLVNNGDSHVDFEFLQSVVALTAPCGGALSGHRTEGDLLAAVDFTSGGTLGSYSLYQWHCAAEPGPQPPDGTVCDPTGVEHYQALAGNPGAVVVVNSGGSIRCGGWICRDTTGASVASILQNDFVEGGVNLAELPFSGCFNTFLPHTRTAQSFTSQLKDFAGPIPLRSCRTPVLSTSSSPSGTTSPGAISRDTVSAGNGGAGFTPTGSVTFFLCGPNAAAGCSSGGSQVGATKSLVAGAATSDAAPAASSPGTYCWRAEYAPDANSEGVYLAAAHTNTSSECFTLSVPGFPNTGLRPADAPTALLNTVALAAGGALVVLSAHRRRRRS